MDLSQGRKGLAIPLAANDATPTVTGNRGLQLEEPLIFEQGQEGRTAVDLPTPAKVTTRLGAMQRQGPIGLPGLS